MDCALPLCISSFPVYIFAEYLPFSGNAICLTIFRKCNLFSELHLFSIIMETRVVRVESEFRKDRSNPEEVHGDDAVK